MRCLEKRGDRVIFSRSPEGSRCILAPLNSIARGKKPQAILRNFCSLENRKFAVFSVADVQPLEKAVASHLLSQRYVRVRCAARHKQEQFNGEPTGLTEPRNRHPQQPGSLAAEERQRSAVAARKERHGRAAGQSRQPVGWQPTFGRNRNWRWSALRWLGWNGR